MIWNTLSRIRLRDTLYSIASEGAIAAARIGASCAEELDALIAATPDPALRARIRHLRDRHRRRIEAAVHAHAIELVTARRNPPHQARPARARARVRRSARRPRSATRRARVTRSTGDPDPDGDPGRDEAPGSNRGGNGGAL